VKARQNAVFAGGHVSPTQCRLGLGRAIPLLYRGRNTPDRFVYRWNCSARDDEAADHARIEDRCDGNARIRKRTGKAAERAAYLKRVTSRYKAKRAFIRLLAY
jgi:hypothetical protein